MRTLVLDLRKNGGGLLNEAVDLSGLFIPTGSILQVRDSQGRIENYRDENPTGSLGRPSHRTHF
jgi:carboxyl-terminal processing protease